MGQELADQIEGPTEVDGEHKVDGGEADGVVGLVEHQRGMPHTRGGDDARQGLSGGGDPGERGGHGGGDGLGRGDVYGDELGGSGWEGGD